VSSSHAGGYSAVHDEGFYSSSRRSSILILWTNEVHTITFSSVPAVRAPTEPQVRSGRNFILGIPINQLNDRCSLSTCRRNIEFLRVLREKVGFDAAASSGPSRFSPLTECYRSSGLNVNLLKKLDGKSAIYTCLVRLQLTFLSVNLGDGKPRSDFATRKKNGRKLGE